jgi:16S rRNA processing protein RimM
MIKQEDVFKIGYFTKPHGIKGEIGFVCTYPLFEQPGDLFLICETEGLLVPFFIEAYRNKTDTLSLIKLAGVDTEEAVRVFSKREAYHLLSQKIDTGDPNASGTDRNSLLGYFVYDSAASLLGEITAIDESTANILWRIDRQGKELLLPAVNEWIVAVDHRKKQLTVAIPEGLLEL